MLYMASPIQFYVIASEILIPYLLESSLVKYIGIHLNFV